jgi:hypothetical protein
MGDDAKRIAEVLKKDADIRERLYNAQLQWSKSNAIIDADKVIDVFCEWLAWVKAYDESKANNLAYALLLGSNSPYNTSALFDRVKRFLNLEVS